MKEEKSRPMKESVKGNSFIYLRLLWLEWKSAL